MSVLILSLGTRGGSLVYAQEIIDRLNLNKTVIVSSNSLVKRPYFNRKWKTHRSLLEFIFLSLTVLPLYLIQITYELAINKYSVLYLPYIHFWSLFFIVLFKLFGKKTVITIHDGVLHSKNGIPIIQIMINRCILMADQLIFLSEYVKESVEKEIKPKGSAFVIPHGSIVPVGLSKVPRTYTEKPNLLFFGKVLPSKGVENLVAAIEQISPNLYNQLLIVGKHYYDLNLKINNSKIVVIDHFIPEDEIAIFFNQADILILPYIQASQSGVATIGIAACLPIVATKTGGLTEQLEENKEGIFVESNPDSIARGILTLINDKNLYETISKNLNNKIHNNMTWQNISNLVAHVIQEAKS